jgi:type II secretory pathway component PulF
MAQRRSMCHMLVLLMERGAKLESSVLLAGQTMTGIVGRAAKKLFGDLHRGVPLPAAIVRSPGALPRETPAYVSAGSSNEVRIAALRELSGTSQGELETIWRSSVDRILYLAAVLLFMTAVLTFVMIRIVPEYAKIFYEFDLELPAMTQLLINLSQYVVDFLAAPIILLRSCARRLSSRSVTCAICRCCSRCSTAFSADGERPTFCGSLPLPRSTASRWTAFCGAFRTCIRPR